MFLARNDRDGDGKVNRDEYVATNLPAIEAAGVPAIFTETLSASTDANALADRIGVEVVELYSDALGEPGSGADTYDGLLRVDAAAIAGALARRAP